jgi:glutaredoxin-like protein NrdH
VTIKIYGREDCVQCDFTMKQLERNGLSFTKIDIDQDEAGRKAVEASVSTRLPMVEVYDPADGKLLDKWHGFKIDKIRELANNVVS